MTTVYSKPARSEQYPGEWHVVYVFEDGELLRQSDLLTREQANKTETEWRRLYVDGRVPV